MAVSAGSRIAALFWVAAVLIAAFPASAQTNDPNLTEEDLDCLRRQAAGGPNACRAGGEEVQRSGRRSRPAAGEARRRESTAAPPADAAADAAARPTPPCILPELIVDLFPNPPPGAAPQPPPGPRSARHADRRHAGQARRQPIHRRLPRLRRARSPLLRRPARRSRSQATFVPDEVLVTVDGDAAVAAAIAAAFGLEVRSQRDLDAARLDRRALRHPRRSPGRRRACAACRRRQDDGARAQPHLRPAAGGGRRELRLPAHRAPARRCQRREREDRRHRHRDRRDASGA